MPFKLLKNQPIDEGIRRIAHEQIEIGLRDYADDSITRNRKVHSLRIRCKKLRGVLRLLQPNIGDAFRIEDHKYKAAANELATNRDERVCARTIASLSGVAAAQPEPGHQVSLNALEKAHQILLSCNETIDTWPVRLHGFYDVAPGFARTYRKCLRAWEAALEEPTDDNFHRLRRWAKYHWHHIRIFERLNKDALRWRRMKLRKLQLLLGDAHDLVILETYLGRSENSDEHLLQQATKRKKKLYDKALKTGKPVFEVPVSDLTADLTGYWADRERNN